MNPSNPPDPPPSDLIGTPPSDDPAAHSAATLLPMVYGELKALAEHRMRLERPGHTLQATALIHEAYGRLAARGACWNSLSHFYHAAAMAMRQILVDYARARRRDKRGGKDGAARRIPIDISNVADLAVQEDPEMILSLDEAMARLEAFDSTAGRIVRLRFFAGLSIEQTAEATNIGVTRVKEKWAFARAFLRAKWADVPDSTRPEGTMNESSRLQELFTRAIELPPQRRATFVDEQCEGAPELRRQLLSLLEANDHAAGFLLDPTITRPPDPVPPTANALAATIAMVPGYRASDSEPTGTQIGRYRIEGVIGEGGFGIVYLARQLQPIQRDVALKIIKPDAHFRARSGYFRAEQQMMAMLDHPNVARVYDAGETADHRPYLVMELIRGQALSAYCRARQVPVRQRIELMIQACRGVQHAHSKGIIHRDLKPANILVTTYDGRAQPKVIDFGIARAIETPDRDASAELIGRYRAAGGTLQYLSPEQADFSPASGDVQSDVYALGIILFELLTHSTPITAAEVRSSALADLVARIRSDEQPSIGSRLASQRQSPVQSPEEARYIAHVSRQVTPELEWIVSKAIAKDRNRRYAGVNELAADLERLLRDEPVSAGPATFRYVARKYLRRHRGAALAAGLLLVTMCVGTATTTIGFFRERAARLAEAHQTELANHAALSERQARLLADANAKVADAARQRALAFSKIIQRAILVNNPLLVNQSMLTLSDLASNIDAELQSSNPQNDVAGPIYMFVGNAKLASGRTDEALADEQLGYEKLYLSMPGSNEMRSAQVQYALCLLMAGHMPEAAGVLDEAKQKLTLSDPRDIRINYCNARFFLSLYTRDYDRATQLLNALIAEIQSAGGSDGGPWPLLVCRLERAMLLGAQGHFDDARQEIHQMVPEANRTFGPRHGTTLVIELVDACLSLQTDGPVPTSRRLRDLLVRMDDLYGPDNLVSDVTCLMLATCYSMSGEPALTSKYLQRVQAAQQKMLSNTAPLQLQMQLFASILGGDGKEMLKSAQLLDRLGPTAQPDVSAATLAALQSMCQRVQQLFDDGHYADVVKLLEPYLRQTPFWKNAAPSQVLAYAACVGWLCESENRLHEPGRADAAAQAWLDQTRKNYPGDSLAVLVSRRIRWWQYMESDQFGPAERFIASEFPTAPAPSNEPSYVTYTFMLGITLQAAGKDAQAIPLLNDTLKNGFSGLQPADWRLAALFLARAYRAANQPQAADQLEKTYGLNPPDNSN